MEFVVLGPIAAHRDGEAVTLGGPKPRAVLARLLMVRGEAVPAERIIDDVWGDVAPRSVTTTLQTYVSSLRRALHADIIEFGAGSYRIRLGDHTLDAATFEQAVTEATSMPDVDDRVATLQRALSLWQGEAYADIDDAPWVTAERVRLAELRRSARESLVDVRLTQGEHAHLVGELEALVRDDAMNERLSAQLMLALYRSGRHADSLRVYARLRDALDESGLMPGRDVSELETAILCHEPHLDWQAPPSTSPLAVSVPTERAPRLPEPATSFIGREAELAEVLELLDDGARLVTIAGPGGVGKTRLSLRAASAREHAFADGVWFVEFAPLTNHDAVAATIARAIGLRDDPTREPMEHLVESCIDREMLLVLDNCEHVIDAVAKVADQFLRNCPNVRLVATSREPHIAQGEYLVRVEALGADSGGDDAVDAVRDLPAAQLFVERANMQRRTFELSDDNAATVARLCRMLDGLPLAIELAAARLDSMPLDALVAGLDHSLTFLAGGPRGDSDRQQTMRGSIDWSWSLLLDDERRLLAALSVFAGSFSHAAATFVATNDSDWLDAAIVSVHLASLVSKSLVQLSSDGRYSLLEMIRVYASEQLQNAGDEERARCRMAHSVFFVRAAHDAEPSLRGPEMQRSVDRFAADHNDLVAVIESDPVAGLELVTTLFEYWTARGLYAFAAESISRMLLAAPASLDAKLKCRAYADLAVFEMRCGNLKGCNEHAALAVALARELDDSWLLARALAGSALSEAGRAEDGLAWADEAVTIATDLANDYLLAQALQSKAISLSALGREAESRATIEHELAVRARLGSPPGRAVVLANLADDDLRRGDVASAKARLEESLVFVGRCSHPLVEVLAHFNLGMVYLGEDDADRAIAQFLSALTVAWNAGIVTEVEYAILGVALATADPAQAATLLASADALLAARDEHLQPLEAARRDTRRAQLLEKLGDEQFAACGVRGAALTRADAMAMARRAGGAVVDGQSSSRIVPTPS